MNTKTKAVSNPIADRIEVLLADGFNTTKIKACLIIEDLVSSDKQAQEAIKAAGLSAKKVGFAQDFYDFLAKEIRSEKEAILFITTDTSDNVKKHKSHYLAIWELSTKIWNR